MNRKTPSRGSNDRTKAARQRQRSALTRVRTHQKQKTRERMASRGLSSLHRIALKAIVVPGTGLEPASQLRRRIFVTLLLSKPASRTRCRSCAGLCLHRRARACLLPVRLRRPPSSLYTFLADAARLGSALPRCAHQGFRRI
ncbi:hypothetical protein BCEP4_750045 [Burkholderia cepacia]|nr:hypothetical protein BCEP4_750045 [Burkholderia cepacia]